MRKVLIATMMLMSWAWEGLAQDSLPTTLKEHFTTFNVRQRYDAFFLDAICQQEKGNLDAAYDLMRHCVELDSTRSEAYFYLSKYHLFMKQKDESLAYQKKAVELEPDNVIYLEALAGLYINQRQFAEATPLLERLSDKQRDREDVLGMLVQMYEQQEEYDKAIGTLTRLETLEGRNERLSYAKSQLYTQKGDRRAAISEMKTLADEYPNDLNFRCLYANALCQNGEEKKGLELYEGVLREEPDNRSAQRALLAYYHNKKDTAQARKYMEMVLMNKHATQEDRIALLRQVIAENEQQGGDSTEVLVLFRRLLEQPQADADIALLCATYMNLKKMPQDSIQHVLEQALTIAPDNAAARLQLVSYAWQAEDRDRVIALCQEARQYNPDEMAFYYYQGIAYYQQHKLDEALNAFKNGISVINSQSDPDIVSDFYAVMGDLLHQKGKEQEAFAAYDSCLVWKEDNIGCLNNYAYYLSLKGTQLDKAEQMSYRTIKAEPKNATYLDTYAWILFMQERYNEAKIYIDQTLQCDSDSSAVLLEHAGDIYYKAGEREKAVALWQEALERSSKGPMDQEDRSAILARKIKLKKYIKE